MISAIFQSNLFAFYRNITQEDYGNYTFLIDASPFNKSFSLTLKPYIIDSLEAKIWKIVVAIIIVLVIIGFVGFLIHQRLYVKIYYKRLFAPFSKGVCLCVCVCMCVWYSVFNGDGQVG